MKVIVCCPSYQWRRGRIVGTSGVYGLVDPLSGMVRYVGSSECVERRLYAHLHSSRPSAHHTPREAWVRALKGAGVSPVAYVLEEATGAHLAVAEAAWIAKLQSTGEADLNVRLTPVGHVNSKDSPGKRRVAALVEENKMLRARVAELESLLQQARG